MPLPSRYPVPYSTRRRVARQMRKVPGARYPVPYVCLVLLCCAGCAILPLAATRVPTVQTGGPPAPISPYHDYRGVIHIHTTYSDGTGTYEQLGRLACRQGLDFLILTDHNTLQPLADGKEGWRPSEDATPRVLLLTGTEVSAPDGHVLALHVRQPINRDQPSQAILDDIARQGGLSFIAHPQYPKKPWSNWAVQGYHGVELYNLVEDAEAARGVGLFLRGLVMPPDVFYRSLVRRPSISLERWDRCLAGGRRVVGIGSADAHGLRAFRLRLSPYDVVFKVVRTHLLLMSALSQDAVYDALQRGHAYLAIDLLGDATGFFFSAAADGEPAGIMGDEITHRPGLTLHMRAPADAHWRLLKDGAVIAVRQAQQWAWPVETPGVYRVEVDLRGRFWIAANPIYVR